MEIYSSIRTTRFIVSTLIILQITVTSSIGESASDKDLRDYVNSHASSQAPMLCQIYSKATRKHIQIMNRKVTANGDDGDKYSNVKKTSLQIGIVSIQGVETEKFLCMSRRGKLVPRRRFGDLCKFTENITSNFYTYFESKETPTWYVGFGKNGKAKRGKRTAKNREACNFLIRDQESNREDMHEGPLEKFAEDFRKKIHGQALTRKRRHKYQTVGPTEVWRSLLNVIGSPPINGSSQEKVEWNLRAKSFLKKSIRSLNNSTLNVADLGNFSEKLTTPDPVISDTRHRSKSRRKGKSKNRHNRSKGKDKGGTKGSPTVVPLREKLLVPKTPIKMHGEELTDPPTVSSPSFEKIQRSQSVTNLLTNSKTADNHSNINDTSKGVVNDSDLNISLNISDKGSNILNKETVAHSRHAKTKLRRGRKRERRTHKSRTTS